jgi:hypothetical protein
MVWLLEIGWTFCIIALLGSRRHFVSLRQAASEGDAIKAREYNAATKIGISYTRRMISPKRERWLLY